MVVVDIFGVRMIEFMNDCGWIGELSI